MTDLRKAAWEHFYLGQDPPPEVLKFHLCLLFGWTAEEYDSMSEEEITNMGIIYEVANKIRHSRGLPPMDVIAQNDAILRELQWIKNKLEGLLR